MVSGIAFAYACHSLLAGSSEAESEAPSISEKNKPSLHIVSLPSFVHIEVQHMEVRPARKETVLWYFLRLVPVIGGVRRRQSPGGG
jgi:hypothetical protein